jgi:inosine/xanthosine triphosphate pyrophosphatase family protein
MELNNMTKSTKPIIRIHNITTDEVIDREMNDAEFAQYQLDKETQAIEKAEAEAKQTAKAAIVDRLGLTADELKLLLG